MLSGPHEEPIDLFITDDELTWEEGGLISLRGSRHTLGAQFLSSMRDDPLAYANQPYWLTGTILGERVEGPIFFDQVYFRHGSEWKEYPYYTDVQVVWNIFANKYADGTVEFGNITKGRGRWGAGIVVEGNTALAESPSVGAGDCVSLLVRNRPEFHALDMGTALLRATPSSMYYSSSPEQIRYLVEQVEAQVVVVDGPQALECPIAARPYGGNLQEYSAGRFRLGLGSQVQAHIEKRFSMPWSQPAARMREFIAALHAIWD